MKKDNSKQSEIAVGLSRELKLFHITMMGVGMMIGAGVFIGIGNAIKIAGPGGVVLTFCLNGVIALFTAMSYAELSSAMPRAGGTYNFSRIAFGRGLGFLTGWMEWFASSVAGSLYAITFAMYTTHYLSQLGLIPLADFQLPVVEKLVGVGIAGLFLYINYRGASQTGTTGALLTLGQMITLSFIALAGVVVAFFHPERLANFEPFLPHGWSKLLITMGLTYVAFEGFEVIAQAGDETIQPRRNLPKAMLYSIFLVVFTYVGLSFASVVAVKDVGEPAWIWIGKHGSKGFGQAISQLLPFGSLLTTVAVIFASTSALNATIYSATRACYALGRDRMLPEILASISKKNLTPYIAVLFTAGIVISVVAFLPTIDVASSASMMFLFLFFLVNLCAIRIRRQMGDELTYGFLMPLFPFAPAAAIVTQALLALWLIHVSLIAWIVVPVWITSGVIIYHAYAKHKTVVTQDEVMVLEEEPIPRKERYRILLAVANPANAVQLAWHCYRFCQAKKAEVEVAHMVPVPPQLSLPDAPRYILTGEEAIAEAMLYLSANFRFGSTIRYCRSISRGIVSTASERKADLLVMGWEGYRQKGFALGSTIDPVLRRTTCNVAILKNCRQQRYRRILVPFAGGPNSMFALETASIFVEKEGGQITVFHVSLPGKAGVDVEAFLRKNLPLFKVDSSLFKPKSVTSSNLLETLLDEARQYDLVVIGASREGLFQQAVMGKLPEEFARQYEKPLIMVKASHPIKSFVRRWI